jgi:hypothetical protein
MLQVLTTRCGGASVPWVVTGLTLLCLLLVIWSVPSLRCVGALTATAASSVAHCTLGVLALSNACRTLVAVQPIKQPTWACSRKALHVSRLDGGTLHCPGKSAAKAGSRHNPCTHAVCASCSRKAARRATVPACMSCCATAELQPISALL